MNLAAFFSYVILTAYTPGPNNIMSMSNAARFGFRRSLPFNFGVFAGFLVVMTAAAAFSSALYNLIPKIKPYMVIAGALYILWLAWTTWKPSLKTSKKGLAQSNTFLTGMVMQFINVKVILYGITAMSSFILPYYRTFGMIALFVLILSVVGFTGTCLWALFGATFEKLFKSHTKAINLIMSLLLVYCAVMMLMELN